MSRKRWKFRVKFEDGNRYVLREVNNDTVTTPRAINFWHKKDDNTVLFTFYPTDTYNRLSVWDRELMKQLEAELKSPNTTLSVLRFAYNDNLIFSASNYSANVPKMPKIPSKPDNQEKYIRNWNNLQEEEKRRKEKEQKRAERIAKLAEEQKAEDKANKKPAPYILHGKHDNNDKEYSWRLTPDKPERQGIEAGNRVLVWTKRGIKEITVTRIEEAQDGVEQPTARVIKKL